MLDSLFKLYVNHRSLHVLTRTCPTRRSSDRGRQELVDDPRFADIPARLANRPVLIEELEKSFVTKTSDEWVELLLAVGIPAGTMYTYPEADRKSTRLNSSH